MLLVKCSSGEFLCHLSDHLWEVVIVAPPPVLSGIAVVQFLWPRVSWNGNKTTGMGLDSTLRATSTGGLMWVTSSRHHVYQPPVAASSHLLLEFGIRACRDDVTHWALTSDRRPVNSLAPVGVWIVCSIIALTVSLQETSHMRPLPCNLTGVLQGSWPQQLLHLAQSFHSLKHTFGILYYTCDCDRNYVRPPLRLDSAETLSV